MVRLPLLLLGAALSASRASSAALPSQSVVATTPEYEIEVALEPEAGRMVLSGAVRLPAASAPRDSFACTLSRLMADVRWELVEPAGLGPLDSSRKEEGDTVRYTLRPGRPVPAGTPVRFRFSYAGGGVSFVFHVGSGVSFAGGPNTAWYPKFPAHQGRGRGRLSFTVPVGHTVLATGRRLGTKPHGYRGPHSFDVTTPCEFSFAAGPYRVVERNSGPIPIRLYLLGPRENETAYLEGSARVLAVLAREFGPYPYPEFAIAEVPSDLGKETGFAGAGMAGFILTVSEALDDSFNLAYYGHEIGHQWWGNLVTQAGDRGAYLLDEAMAQLGALRAVESIDGSVSAEEFRRGGYPGYERDQSGYGYLLQSESGRDHALLDLPDGRASHALANSKGFLVLDLLAEFVGRQRFRRALRGITRTHAFRSVTWEEFAAAVQKASRRDLSWFLSQWLERTGAPDWHLAWRQRRTALSGEISQAEPYYRASLEVEVLGTNGERALREVEVAGPRTEFAWTMPFRVRAVNLDPRFRVLHWVPELRVTARARRHAERANLLRAEGKLDEAEAVLRSSLASVSQPDTGGERFYGEYALARVLIERKSWRDAQAHLDAALAAPIRDRALLPWVYYRYAIVAKELKDEERLRWAVDAAISADAAAGSATGAADSARSLLPPDGTSAPPEPLLLTPGSARTFP